MGPSPVIGLALPALAGSGVALRPAPRLKTGRSHVRLRVIDQELDEFLDLVGFEVPAERLGCIGRRADGDAYFPTPEACLHHGGVRGQGPCENLGMKIGAVLPEAAEASLSGGTRGRNSLYVIQTEAVGPSISTVLMLDRLIQKVSSDWIIGHDLLYELYRGTKPGGRRRGDEVDESLVLDKFTSGRDERSPCLFFHHAPEQRGKVSQPVPCRPNTAA